ncbi:MAG: hypothetical protein GF398_16680 [Chitinivibrionales bacterium]|nr:hypothetical protein [Chitinivibrionales bacterium]
MGRLFILTGPSCAGKSPMHRCLARVHPEMNLMLKKVVLFNSRAPRIGEVEGKDYYFRPREHIEQSRSADDFLVMEVRGDLQALDLKHLRENLISNDALYEGNPYVAHQLAADPSLAHIEKLSMYLSPVSREEMEFMHTEQTIDPRKLVADIMRRKLLRRTRNLKGELALPDLQTIERRATSAYEELLMAHHFDHVLVNHDGEDSENWEAFYYPMGDARRSFENFVLLLRGEPAQTEQWKPEF